MRAWLGYDDTVRGMEGVLKSIWLLTLNFSGNNPGLFELAGRKTKYLSAIGDDTARGYAYKWNFAS